MKIGDRVSWTHCSVIGRTMNMSLREGVIVEIGSANARVKRTEGGKSEVVSLKRLRAPDQKSQITEFVEGMRDWLDKGKSEGVDR